MARAKKQPEPETMETAQQEPTNQQPEPETVDFRVVTARGPFWSGERLEYGTLISAMEDAPAILLMLERGWLERV